MRALLLIASAALALGGCGNNVQKDNSQNADENLTAENIVSNDVTAIDAVTGDAANMAADVDMNFGNINENAPIGTSASTKPTRPLQKNVAANAAESITNSVADSATNAQ